MVSMCLALNSAGSSAGCLPLRRLRLDGLRDSAVDLVNAKRLGSNTFCQMPDDLVFEDQKSLATWRSRERSIGMPQWTVRLPEELAQQVQRAAKERGFSSPRSFIREAVRKELQGPAGDTQDIERRVAASLDRLVSELRRLGTAQ